MTFDDYEIEAEKTAIYPRDRAKEYAVLGLVNEAGEVAGKFKKWIRDGALNVSAIHAELGDVLWYLSRCCYEFGTTLEEVAGSNLAKLADRRERGVLGGSGDSR